MYHRETGDRGGGRRFAGGREVPILDQRVYTSAPLRRGRHVSSPWAVIDGLVHDIGALSVQVQVAERTLATDPRTVAARHALDCATDAVCTAIDETSASAAAKAASAIADTRALIVQLGLTAETSRSLVHAAGELIATAEKQRQRTSAIRRRFKRTPRTR